MHSRRHSDLGKRGVETKFQKRDEVELGKLQCCIGFKYEHHVSFGDEPALVDRARGASYVPHIGRVFSVDCSRFVSLQKKNHPLLVSLCVRLVLL